MAFRWNPKDSILAPVKQQSLSLVMVHSNQHFEYTLTRNNCLFKERSGEFVQRSSNLLSVQRYSGCFRTPFCKELVQFLIGAINEMPIASASGKNGSNWKAKVIKLVTV